MADKQKKRKCGHEYRKEKEASQRKEAASSCSKLETFWVLKSQKKPEDEENHPTPTVVIASEEKPSVATSTILNIDDCENEECEKLDPESSTQMVVDPGPGEFFEKPTPRDFSAFFAFHPKQPSEDENSSPLPFEKSVYTFKSSSNDRLKRNWLSYNSIDKKLYCSVCLAFSDNSSIFCQGFDRYRHVTQTVGEHEKSKSHLESVKCFIGHSQKQTIDFLLFEKQIDKRKQEVAERRKVLHGVIDVIKLIGKQGLALRGKRHEEGYSLGNLSLNHGNFLEIFLLLSNYDDSLGKHVKNVISTSTAALEKRRNKKEKGGRGTQTTFLSKTTVVNIVSCIKEIMVADIVKEIKQAVIFSVLMDTTIDVSGYDQCAIVLRYVTEKEVKEKLLGLITIQSTTATGLLQSLLTLLEANGLNVANCVADAFDGASNMNGEYNGLAGKLKQLVPNHTHTWCYAHVLNLVMTDTVQCLPATISFFGLLQETQVFIKDSCKRLNVYMQRNPKIRLTAIGATRWRSRSDAATKIFGFSSCWFSDIGTENKHLTKPVYADLVISLNIISNSMEFNPKTRNEANALLSKFLSYETILIAMTFLKIFSSTTPLSDYLQTRNLDFSQAWALVAAAQKSLEKLRNESAFENIKAAANRFVFFMTASINQKVDEDPSLDTEKLIIDTELPKKRVRTAKRVHGDTGTSEDAFASSSEEEQFRIKVYNVIVDKLNGALNSRFSNQKQLYLDLSCFDPRRFPEFKKNGLPPSALNKICTLVNVDRGKLQEELQYLFEVWSDLKLTMTEKFSDLKSESSNGESDEDDEEGTTCSSTSECKQCVKCVFNVINEYNLYSVSFPELHKVYKFILTIPLTQVSCERTFSTLKFVKSRLRATLNQDNLEALVMMQIERDRVTFLDNDMIIAKLCEKSNEMKRLLII